jgi:DNA-binding CsgD family transcriptional regulator
VSETAVFSDVVEAIYGIPDRPESIFRALELIGAFAGTPDIHLLVSGPAGTRVLAAQAGMADKLSSFWSTRELAPLLKDKPAGDLVDIGRLVGYTCPTWAGALATALPSPPDCDGSMLVVPLLRSHAGAHAELAARIQQVLSHLARAIVLWRRLDADMPTVKTTAQLVRELPLPALLTDSQGRCIESNGPFTRLKSSLGVQVLGGRLWFRDEYLQDSWQSGLHETAGTAVGRSLLADSGMGRQWKVHLQPVQSITSARNLEVQHFVLAVFEEQGAMPYADPERIASVSKLTPAELKVLSGLLQGFTGKVIARSRNASVNTVRSQIMSILTKTGHHSQKELIASFSASTFDPSSILQQSDLQH